MVLVYIFEVDCLRVLVWCVLYYVSSFPMPVYLSKGVSVLGLGRNFMCL